MDVLQEENYLQLKYRRASEYAKTYYSIDLGLFLQASFMVMLFVVIGIVYGTAFYQEKYDSVNASLSDISNYSKLQSNPTSTLYFFVDEENGHGSATDQWMLFCSSRCIKQEWGGGGEGGHRYLYRTRNSKHILVECVYADCTTNNIGVVAIPSVQSLVVRFNLFQFPTMVLTNGAPSNVDTLNNAVHYLSFSISVDSIAAFMEDNCVFVPSL